MKNNQIPVFEDAFNLINQSLSLEVQNQKRETALLQSPVWYPERDSSRTPYSLTSMNSRLWRNPSKERESSMKRGKRLLSLGEALLLPSHTVL